MDMSITLLYAGMLAVLLLALSWNVVRFRRRLRVGLGDGGHPELQRAIRVHGNFLEYAPLGLILLGLLEADGLPAGWLHLAGASLVICRLLHAFGLSGSDGTSFGRFVGTLGTWIVLAALAVTAIARALI
ncbi:MAG: MAPEG family protein [Gammaproteobacteria bacterium]|nr:MAG: MAPEG family protein [Gammaproteobacteria bacterium]